MKTIITSFEEMFNNLTEKDKERIRITVDKKTLEHLRRIKIPESYLKQCIINYNQLQ